MAAIKKEEVIAGLAVQRLRGESLDKIADEIVMISDAIRILRSRSRLNEDTLLLLIQNAIGSNAATKYRSMPIKTIKQVLDGIEAMQTKHLKTGELPKKGKT